MKNPSIMTRVMFVILLVGIAFIINFVSGKYACDSEPEVRVEVVEVTEVVEVVETKQVASTDPAKQARDLLLEETGFDPNHRGHGISIEYRNSRSNTAVSVP